VLRISVESVADLITIRLEGKVVGLWAEECRRTWLGIREERGSKKLRIDLRGTTYVDGLGMAVLREMQRMTGAEILADAPLTRYFAEQVMRPEAETENEGV